MSVLEEARKALLLQSTGVNEVRNVVLEFECDRRRRGDGAGEPITVKIYDAGPARPQYRYHAHASASDGRVSVGNPEPTIEDAISNLHWSEFDREPGE